VNAVLLLRVYIELQASMLIHTGTPDEQSWPGVANLPDYQTTFPRWKAQNLGKLLTRLDEEGVDILTV